MFRTPPRPVGWVWLAHPAQTPSFSSLGDILLSSAVGGWVRELLWLGLSFQLGFGVKGDGAGVGQFGGWKELGWN